MVYDISMMLKSDVQVRFWKLVDKQADCWLWTGVLAAGYGQFSNTSVSKAAHRASYEFLVGEIPKGMHLHHACGNKQCVNPAHLVLLAPSDHMRLHSRKAPRKTSSYRLAAGVHDAVRLMADTKQVSQADIIEEAVRLLSANQKAGTK